MGLAEVPGANLENKGLTRKIFRYEDLTGPTIPVCLEGKTVGMR